MSVLVITILIHSLACSALFAQTLLPSSNDDLYETTEQAEDPDVTLDMTDLPSLILTSHPLKNLSTLAPQLSSDSVSRTAMLTPETTEITVAETIAESTPETAIVTMEVPSSETDSDSEDTFETPVPSLETSSIYQTSEVTWPQTPVQTSDHESWPISTQATTAEAFFSTPSGSTSQNDQSTVKHTTEDSIILTSKSYPTKTFTEVAPSVIPESAQTHSSKPSSELEPTYVAGYAPTSDKPHTSPKTQGFGIVIIIIIVLLVCVSGIIFLSMFINKRRKRRTENFSTSFRNGGSSKSKKKKGTEEDAWFGPVALKGEDELEAGEEGAKEMDGRREGEGAQMVLSTFMAKEEEKDGANGSCVGEKEDIKKDEEVPLLITEEDVKEATAPPLSSSVPPALSQNDAGELNGSAAFCLTSAV